MTKKQLIIDKAIELFAEKGIEATSIQQITEQCGISKGAFYLSFSSKDELVLSIIDHFMRLITADIDQLVRQEKDPQIKLYEFYLTTFQLFEKYAKFAKVLFREQLQSIHDAFIEKINYYDNLTNQATLRLLDELYGERIEDTKYDVLVVMKGFIHIYSQLLFAGKLPFNLQLLSETLVEKTNIIAEQTKLPFLTEEIIQLVRNPAPEELSTSHIIEEIERLTSQVEDPIELESLSILKEQLQGERISQAILLGLLHNLANNEQCKWLIYLVKQKYTP
ncbi:TetR/AcrR family transcriptional regulator [Bacillus thermotolerans]|uniref:TetR family transcriptional regulator probably coupled to RND multidrug efflux transporter n=1 Tax=Bacillus thermotolerans TaxID=1221996 RepID=A0A0F5HM60_BACTR|nr:TetR/AcrR family transcriptional regulator [Bacillus thermotolerans]KKB34376.1 TetR family transcriptional regulator probably coupled to RND multidrug efflux transporter [Bacillus thermotolerans]KKB34483.1 TetR family transcriptional regulator probably coupled to RND multidrug efflux transporter [Bacillus thermotolerans]